MNRIVNIFFSILLFVSCENTKEKFHREIVFEEMFDSNSNWYKVRSKGIYEKLEIKNRVLDIKSSSGTISTFFNNVDVVTDLNNFEVEFYAHTEKSGSVFKSFRFFFFVQDKTITNTNNSRCIDIDYKQDSVILNVSFYPTDYPIDNSKNSRYSRRTKIKGDKFYGKYNKFTYRKIRDTVFFYFNDELLLSIPESKNAPINKGGFRIELVGCEICINQIQVSKLLIDKEIREDSIQTDIDRKQSTIYEISDFIKNNPFIIIIGFLGLVLGIISSIKNLFK